MLRFFMPVKMFQSTLTHFSDTLFSESWYSCVFDLKRLIQKIEKKIQTLPNAFRVLGRQSGASSRMNLDEKDVLEQQFLDEGSDEQYLYP